jgi:anti-sigma B factor antagonist
VNGPISLRICIEEHYALVRIGGELDFASAPATQDFLLHAMAGCGARLVIDVAGVTFIDSTGMAALQLAAQNAVQRGGWVRLVGPGPQFRRVLNLLRVTAFVPTYATALDAATADTPIAAPG